MKWSILVPTIPERAELRAELMATLYAQAAPHPDVEVLMLEDDRRIAYGDKLQTLATIARGTWVSYVDDDDWVADRYVEAILDALAGDPDAVTFTVEYTADGADPRLVFYGRDHPVATNDDGTFLRPIQHLQPVRRSIVAAVPYEGGFGADIRWSQEVQRRGLIGTAAAVAGDERDPLYHYRWRSGDPDGLWPDQH